MTKNYYISMGYAVVSKGDPFLTVTVRHANLTEYASIGAGLTGLKVYRVGKDFESDFYLPVDVKGDTYKFVLDATFLDKDGGRYEYEFVYKGNVIGRKQFVYDKPSVEFLRVT